MHESIAFLFIEFSYSIKNFLKQRSPPFSLFSCEERVSESHPVQESTKTEKHSGQSAPKIHQRLEGKFTGLLNYF